MVSASISVVCGKTIGPIRQQGDRELSSPDEKLSCDPEPRSGERYIAWGVSPRTRARIKEKAAERRQKCGADAIGSRRSTNLSPPPGACGLFAVPTLGLTPQAKNMPLLRSSSSGVNLSQDETLTGRLHPASGIWYLIMRARVRTVRNLPDCRRCT